MNVVVQLAAKHDKDNGLLLCVFGVAFIIKRIFEEEDFRTMSIIIIRYLSYDSLEDN